MLPEMLPQFEIILILMNSDFHLLSCLISISFWLETHCQYFANVQHNCDCSLFIYNKHYSIFKISKYFGYSPLIPWTESLSIMGRNLYKVLMKDFSVTASHLVLFVILLPFDKALSPPRTIVYGFYTRYCNDTKY